MGVRFVYSAEVMCENVLNLIHDAIIIRNLDIKQVTEKHLQLWEKTLMEHCANCQSAQVFHFEAVR
jgi:hypothetical protein